MICKLIFLLKFALVESYNLLVSFPNQPYLICRSFWLNLKPMDCIYCTWMWKPSLKTLNQLRLVYFYWRIKRESLLEKNRNFHFKKIIIKSLNLVPTEKERWKETEEIKRAVPKLGLMASFIFSSVAFKNFISCFLSPLFKNVRPLSLKIFCLEKIA